jgi:hypothetical protein
MYPRKLYRPWPLWLCWTACVFFVTFQIIILAMEILNIYGNGPQLVPG